MSDASTVTTPIPPLEDGQRLTREEFERRYEAMPHVKKADLLEGVVYMPSPVSADNHGDQDGIVMWWLNCYRMVTPGVGSAHNATVRLDDENEPQPDAVMYVRPEWGGEVRKDAGYIVSAPDLAVEVSYSRVQVDLGPRFRVYRDHGVREYVVWRIDTNVVLWFVLRGEEYEALLPDAAGVIRSEAFPGLWLDTIAMAQLDMNGVYAALQQGVASPEHAAFVAALQQRRQP